MTADDLILIPSSSFLTNVSYTRITDLSYPAAYHCSLIIRSLSIGARNILYSIVFFNISVPSTQILSKQPFRLS